MLFADVEDIDYQQQALNAFRTIKLNTNETIFAFNKRFGVMYCTVISSGQAISDKERIRRYLCALKQHTDSRILYDVKNMLRDYDSGVALTLADVQRQLVREEEHVQGAADDSAYDQQHIVARHASRNRPNSRRGGDSRGRISRHANASRVSFLSTGSSNGTIYK